MAPHSEHLPYAMRSGLKLCREMGGVGHKTYIVYLVFDRHNSKRVMKQHITPVDGLEIFLAALTMVTKHLKHVFPQVPFLGNILQLLHRLGITNKTICGVPSLRHPTP